MNLEPLRVNHLDIVPKLVEVERDHLLRKELLQAIKMIVRVYIIEGNNLSSRDIGGMSDPYIILKLGQKVHNEPVLFLETVILSGQECSLKPKTLLL